MSTPTDQPSTETDEFAAANFSHGQLESEPWPLQESTGSVQQRMDLGDQEPEVDEADQIEAELGWTRADRLFLAAGCSVIFVLLILRWHQLTGGNIQPVEFTSSESYEFRVDINSATWVEWSQLNGIGAKTARDIVADRDTHGPFVSIDDIQRVKGVGPSTLKRIRPFLIEPQHGSSP